MNLKNYSLEIDEQMQFYKEHLQLHGLRQIDYIIDSIKMQTINKSNEETNF